jgi:alanine dehydrogenase
MSVQPPADEVLNRTVSTPTSDQQQLRSSFIHDRADVDSLAPNQWLTDGAIDAGLKRLLDGVPGVQAVRASVVHAAVVGGAAAATALLSAAATQRLKAGT